MLRKKYLSVVNPPPPQTMWPNCVSSKSERPQKMHLRLKIDFLILKTREGLAPSYHYDMIIIADISHYRHYQRKCTFFKVVYFWADITQKMLSRIYALLVYFLQALNALVYRSYKILRMYPIRCLHILHCFHCLHCYYCSHCLQCGIYTLINYNIVRALW